MVHIYHPSKSGKGFAASFWYSERDKTVFATLLKQSGWDEKTQNGIFKGNIDNPEGRVNIKLDFIEASAILDCIERGREFKSFHDNDETPKQIAFTPWIGQDGKQKGYSFSVTVTNKQDTSYKNSFYIGLTFAEGRLIREFFIFTLHQHFARLRQPKSLVPTSTTAQPKEEQEISQEESTPNPSLLDF